jgi:hypothetical protein
MKPGTIEYTIKTERKSTNIEGIPTEEIITEYTQKVRGYDSEDTFNKENPNSELIEKVRQEHKKILMSNPNILRYQSNLVERLSLPEK